MLSRPNIVMNHGSPAAGRARPGIVSGREPQRGEIDEAALVRRLQRVPVALEARRRREPLLEVRAPCCGRGLALQRACFDRIALVARTPATAVTTSRSVVHSPCGSIVDGEREAVLVDLRPGAVGGDPRLAREASRARSRARAVAARRGCRYVPFFFEGVLDLEQIGEVAARLDPDRERRPASRRG